MSRAAMPARPRLLSYLAPRVAAGLLVPSACASPEPLTFDVRVEAFSARSSEPVAGAVLRVRGEPGTTTDTRGLSLLRVRGQAGDRVPVSLTCPGGAASEAELILPPAPVASGEQPPALRLACPDASHDAVVLVHASGGAASLPVKVDGAIVGHTDSLGFAHVHVRGGDGASFEVSLDTSASPALAPANPTRHFELEHGDELFVFDTVFAANAPVRKPRRAPGRPRSSSGGAD